MPKGLIALLLLLCLSAPSHGAERAVMKVFLNEEDRGEYFVAVTNDGRILLSPEDLLVIGFKEVPADAETGEGGYLYIDSFSSGVKIESDQKASVLRITAEPGLLRKNSFDLSHRMEEKVLYAAEKSAFLNYGLTMTAGSDLDFGSLTVPLELGVSGGGWLGLSDFAYTKTGADERFVRLLTSVIRDDPAGLRRLVIGDFQAFSGNLGSGATLGGLSIARNFSMSPFFVRSPGLNVHGMLRTASDVEIYTNDMLLRRSHLSPGEFEFLNLPNLNGAGEVAIVIKDAFGRVEKIEMPYYVSTTLLKTGLQDYSYNFGFKRREFGRESFNYGGPAFLGFHRTGFSDFFTGGFRAEADKGVVNAGPTATLLLGKLGLLDSSFAFSRSSGRSGYGFISSYSYAGRYVSFGLSARGFSRDYANLALPFSGDKPRFEGSAGVGFRQKMFGSLSVSYSVSDLHLGTDSKRVSMFYSRNLLRNVSLNVMASRTEAEKRTYEVFAGLTFVLGRDTFAGLDYGVRDGLSTQTATLQKNPPLGAGFGYRVTADRSYNGAAAGGDHASTGGHGLLQYRGPFGIYSAEYRRLSGQNSYIVSASGAAAFIDRSLFFTRPITDGFVLVKVGEFGDAQVNYNNQEVGLTNRKGEVIVPGIISYYPNNISINDKDFPVNYEIPEINKYVSVSFRGGGVLKFDLRKLQAFVGRLYIVEKGRKTEAEYWGLAIGIDGLERETVVGKRGEFYIENIHAGKFPARLFMREKKCTFDLTIPESDEAMVDMGEVVCEME